MKMDSYNQLHHVVISSKYQHNYLLKRSLLLLITFSLFSLLISFSWGFSFTTPSFAAAAGSSVDSSSSSSYVYFNPFLSSFFTHSLERKYMFLICNGILVFLATSSTTTKKTSSSSSSASDDHDHEGLVLDSAAATEGPEIDLVEEGEDKGTKEDDGDDEKDRQKVEDKDEGCTNELQQQEEEKREMVKEDGEIAEEEEEEGLVLKEGGNGEEMMGCNTEELNRRIEEFIRKMKEEMRIESQQQLVAAV